MIYRAYLLPGKEEEYLKAWAIVARYFVEKRGAIGSTLHRTEEGLWVAYSRWPDKKTRDATWLAGENLPDEISEVIRVLKNCLDPERVFPDICMDIVDEIRSHG